MAPDRFWTELREADLVDLDLHEAGSPRAGSRWARYLWGRTGADGQRLRASGQALLNREEKWAIVHEQGASVCRMIAHSPEDAIRRFLSGDFVDLDKTTFVDVDLPTLLGRPN